MGSWKRQRGSIVTLSAEEIRKTDWPQQVTYPVLFIRRSVALTKGNGIVLQVGTYS
jgi:hypothetical protein